jgi:hypothetical protein
MAMYLRIQGQDIPFIILQLVGLHSGTMIFMFAIYQIKMTPAMLTSGSLILIINTPDPTHKVGEDFLVASRPIIFEHWNMKFMKLSSLDLKYSFIYSEFFIFQLELKVFCACL